ncbi:MAG: hypothetical protein ACFFBD_13920 [Candidatus Hodarchaeota archaeon]
MSIKTFSWIARQPYSIRYGEKKIESDKEDTSEEFLQERPTSADIKFKKGKIWPTLILIKNLWNKEEEIEVFLRLFRKEKDLLVDIWKGHDMEAAAKLAEKYDIPIYSVGRKRNGKRSFAYRLNLASLA